MTEVSVAQEEKIEAPSVIVENCSKCPTGEDRAEENASPCASPKSTGAKVKQKKRSTRRRLNALMNNTSLHFSDTDSEGELTMVMPLPGAGAQQTLGVAPVISVTLSDDDGRALSDRPSAASTRRGSFVENLTDVDEIYASDPETDAKPANRTSLKVDDDNRGGETDLEDFSNEEDDEDDYQAPVYVIARSDILCEFSGDMITTKEGDGPFSVEIRNRMSEEAAALKEAKAGSSHDNPEIVVMPNTDSEDMDVSDEDDLQEASCSRRDLPNDFDVLAASQIVMRNVSKPENNLSVQDAADEAGVSESHTDVEDVE